MVRYITLHDKRDDDNVWNVHRADAEVRGAVLMVNGILSQVEAKLHMVIRLWYILNDLRSKEDDNNSNDNRHTHEHGHYSNAYH